MKTKRPISGLTWSDPQWTKLALDDLVQNDEIMFYAFINHKAEDLDKKDHIHLYIEPHKAIDTCRLVEYLTQYVSTCEKPIKPSRVWQFSKFEHWLWYSLHNKSYLMEKGLQKKYEYQITDIITSDETILYERYQNIESAGDRKKLFIDKMLEINSTWEEVVISGVIPIVQLKYYKEYFFAKRNINTKLKSYIEKNAF